MELRLDGIGARAGRRWEARAAVAPHRRAAGAGLYARGVKRALDLLIVLLVALPVLFAILPLIAVIALDGRSPFYVQHRLGRGGRVFRMWKLRSMVPQADRVLEATLAADPAARLEWNRHQKLRYDPRITPIGRLIRKSSLDELPQLLNVALGDMSIVGPRPMLPEQRDLYPGTEYFSMRPGITGFWQVSVRNESSFEDRAAFDRDYHEALSFGTDLSIIGRTFQVVLRGTGC